MLGGSDNRGSAVRQHPLTWQTLRSFGCREIAQLIIQRQSITPILCSSKVRLSHSLRTVILVLLHHSDVYLAFDIKQTSAHKSADLFAPITTSNSNKQPQPHKHFYKRAKMPPELRKRKAPAAEPAAAPPAKKKGPVAKAVAKVKEDVTPKTKTKTNGTTNASKVAVGITINLEGFGGEIETNDGTKTTLKKLVDESKAGVVLFTYPKASTPGCKYRIVFLFKFGFQRLILDRYYSGMPVPRPIRSLDGNRLLHLRIVKRFTKGQHQLQRQAEAPVPSPLRHFCNPHLRYRLEEGSKRHNSWRLRY